MNNHCTTRQPSALYAYKLITQTKTLDILVYFYQIVFILIELMKLGKYSNSWASRQAGGGQTTGRPDGHACRQSSGKYTYKWTGIFRLDKWTDRQTENIYVIYLCTSMCLLGLSGIIPICRHTISPLTLSLSQSLARSHACACLLNYFGL